MRVLVIIPAYNEEATIGSVVSRIKMNTPFADILVVNDASTDNTAWKAQVSGANVVNLPFNLGIGGAMQTGYLYASRKNYDIAVQVDGDGQHDPIYINRLLQPVLTNTADMAIGSRFVTRTSYQSSFARRMGITFFSMLVNLITGKKVKDTTSGFRVVNRTIINYFAETYPPDYPEVDVLVKLHKKGYKICEIPVEMYERRGGKSSITPLRSIYYMVKVSLSLIIGAMKASDN